MNLVKIETLRAAQALINPEHVTAISIDTSSRYTGAVKCTRISLINGDIIESPWTCAKVLSALDQTVYDPTTDPDVEVESTSAESLAGQVKQALLTLRKHEHAISRGSKLFNNRISLNDVIVPLNAKFAAVVNISDYIALSGESRGVDLKIGPANSPFGARVAARYGIPALQDKDLEIGPELVSSYFDPALVELLIEQLNKWVAALD